MGARRGDPGGRARSLAADPGTGRRGRLAHCSASERCRARGERRSDRRGPRRVPRGPRAEHGGRAARRVRGHRSDRPEPARSEHRGGAEVDPGPRRPCGADSGCACTTLEAHRDPACCRECTAASGQDRPPALHGGGPRARGRAERTRAANALSDPHQRRLCDLLQPRVLGGRAGARLASPASGAHRTPRAPLRRAALERGAAQRACSRAAAARLGTHWALGGHHRIPRRLLDAHSDLRSRGDAGALRWDREPAQRGEHGPR